MFDESLFPINSPHEIQVDPHRLLNATFPYMHDQRIWQIGRPIFPGWKRWLMSLRIVWAQAKAERRGLAFTTRPPLPEESRPRACVLSFFCIAHPDQLNHGICKRKTPICGTLSGMLIWRTFTQAKPNQFLCLGSTSSGADEQVIQFSAHARSLMEPHRLLCAAPRTVQTGRTVPCSPFPDPQPLIFPSFLLPVWPLLRPSIVST